MKSLNVSWPSTPGVTYRDVCEREHIRIVFHLDSYNDAILLGIETTWHIIPTLVRVQRQKKRTTR